LNMNQSDASLRWVTIIAWQLSNASISYDCSQKGKSERTVCITANGRAGVPHGKTSNSIRHRVYAFFHVTIFCALFAKSTRDTPLHLAFPN
jgi:hypothetical protein